MQVWEGAQPPPDAVLWCRKQGLRALQSSEAWARSPRTEMCDVRSQDKVGVVHAVYRGPGAGE